MGYAQHLPLADPTLNGHDPAWRYAGQTGLPATNSSATAYERIVDALREHGRKVTDNGTKATAQCPVPGHDDSNPSLSITRSDGRALLWCHGPCDTGDVVTALGLTMADLYDERRATYRYTDGRIVERYYVNGKKRFSQKGAGAASTLYHLERLQAAGDGGVFLVEGEADVHAIEAAQGIATTAPQGADSFHKVDVEPLRGRHVTVVVDRDAGGDKWAAQVAAKLAGVAARCRFVHAEVGCKDASDHVAAGHGLDRWVPYEWPEEPPDPPQDQSQPAHGVGVPLAPRQVDLGPYLDGTYSPPQPTVGGLRDDNAALLYPGLWHTVIALTTAGKSWFALWHAVAALRAGQVVVYAHFEESTPAGTLGRLRALAPDIPDDQLRQRFIWLDCTRRWEPGEFAVNLPAAAALVILDGINAACAKQGWPVDKPEAVGAYRQLFVTPAARSGAAALSLGHPPKARDRQGERHGFGSTAWLDEVDGVGFRLEASRKTPIHPGGSGYSALYSVKDRYGQVEAKGTLETAREAGWYYLGAFTLDSTPGTDNTAAYLVAADEAQAAAHPADAIDALGAEVVRLLESLDDHRFGSQRKLGDLLRAAGVPVNDKCLGPALERLAMRGHIEWPEVEERRARPGWLPKIRTAVEGLE